MRILLAAALALFALPGTGWSFDPFPATEPVTFSFLETYKDVVVPDPDFPGDYVQAGRNLVDITGSAPLALTPEQLGEIDELTDIDIDVGDFSFSGSLSDDENFDSSSGDRVVRIPVEGYNDDGDDIQIGTITLRWSATRVTFNVQISNAPDEYWIVATDYYPGVVEPAINGDDLLAAFTFGDYSFDTRTVYFSGYARVDEIERGGNTWSVSDVRVEGSIDSTAPEIAITQPAPGIKTLFEFSDVTDGVFTISGTASDIRKIGDVSFPGRVVGVDVQFGPIADPGPFVPAEFDPGTGNWSLPNAPIVAGKNILVVRAMDEHGNFGFTASRTIALVSEGDIIVTSEAAGYGPESDGTLVGTISGENLAGRANSFDVLAGVPPTVNKKTNVESGQIFRVIARPRPGTAFDGWTGVINGVTRLTSVSPVLDFETKPNLVLTARFVPDPFGSLAGTYHGLVGGSDANDRGTILIKVKAKGAFSGSVKIGAVTLSLKGIILGGGHWEGVVTRKGKQFSVSFDLNVSDTGDRLLTGTITGEEVDSTFDADRKEWRKPRRNDPGNTAEAFMGTYNVVLPADNANTDPNFPRGIGYGRVKITKLGGVSFVGNLGDGSKAKSTSVLVQRESGPVFFYLFVPLDKKLGNCAGVVTYDSADPETDLTGTLDWSEPPTRGVEPEAFEGKVAVFGSRYQKPPTGSRVILQNGGGAAHLRLFGPAYTKPANDNSLPVSIQINPANLTTANEIGPVGAENLKLRFSVASGLFRGTYKDPDRRRNVPTSGIAVQKMNGGSGYAGGVFVRGNRAGFIELNPPAP